MSEQPGARTMTDVERAALVPYLTAIPAGLHYLEIGVWAGASLAVAREHVPGWCMTIGVDPWDPAHVGAFVRYYQLAEHPAVQLLARMHGGPGDRLPVVVPVASKDFQRSPLFDLIRSRIGLLLIDGFHEADALVTDAECIALVPEGGVVAFHDYHPEMPSFADYSRAVDDAIEAWSLRREATTGSLVICRRRVGA